MAAPVPDIQDLWIESGRPGAHKFRQILIRKGIAAPSERYLSEHFLKYQSSKQLFAPGPRYTGKIWSPGLDRRWQTDVLVNSQKPSEHKGTKWAFALVVVDVFSRYIWTRFITSPMEAYVGFGEILDEARKAPASSRPSSRSSLSRRESSSPLGPGVTISLSSTEPSTR